MNRFSDAHVLALDIGTSSTRVLLIDAKGDKAGHAAQRQYDQTTTVDGGVETSAAHLLELTMSCIDEVHQQTEPPVSLAATSCFMHSLMAIDSEGDALSPLYSWADNRAAKDVSLLRAMLDEDAAHERTGCVFHASYWPAKLLWLQRTRPELFVPGTLWVSFGEYMMRQLTGGLCVSLSMASGTGIFNQWDCEWDDGMLASLPIEKDSLPPLVDFSESTSRLTQEYAARWPKLQSTTWYPPLGDGPCSNVGTGGIDQTAIVVNVGTSGAARMLMHEPAPKAPPGLWRYRLDRRRSLIGGAVSNAGNVFAWAKQNLQLPNDTEAQLSAMSPDSHALTVLPFLAGERAPLWNADARFVLAGASLDTNAVHILRACLEAASFRFAEIVERLLAALPPQNSSEASARVLISGGALAKSAAWLQITCDAFGVSLYESQEPEASARGAALMALEAAGVIDDIAEVSFEFREPINFIPEHVEIYREARRRQNALIRVLLDHEPAT